MANHQTNASRNSEIIDDALRTMLQYTPDIMFVKDVNLIYAAASQSFAELAGKASADDVIGKTDFELFDNPQLAQKYVDNDRSLFASGAPLTEYIEPLPEKDGLPRYSSTSKYIIRDRDGNAAGLLGIGRDITCEYQAKENYRHELNYFFQLPEDICAAVLFDITGWRVTDARSRESYDAILPPGGTIEDYLKNVRESIVDDEHASSFFHAFSKDSLITLYESGRRSLSVEYLRRMPGNEQHWIREDAHFRTDPVNGHIVLMMILHDIDSIKREEKELIYAAEQDVLTGLLNRSATMKRITRFLKEEGASGTHALFMVDVDNFKSINDTFGHQMGDYVLADIAATLRHCFRESDISGRIGGDEFFILMKNVQSPDAVEKKAKELTEALQYVCSTSKSSVELSGSVGISVYNGDFKKLEALYAEADAALYEAKALGKKRFCIAGTKKKAVDFVMDENETANAVHLRTILENMDGAIFVAEIKGEEIRIVFTSQSIFKKIGHRVEDIGMGGQNLFNIVYSQDLPALKKAIIASAESGKNLDHEYRVCAPDGTIAWRHCRGSIISVKEDGAVRILFVSSDITELKRKEKELSFAELRYRTAVEQSGILLWENDLKTHTLIHSGEYWKALGFEEKYVIEGGPDSIISLGMIHPDSVQTFRKMFQDMTSGRESDKYIIHSTDPQGNSHWALNHYVLLRDEDGCPYYAIGIARALPTMEADRKLFSREERFLQLISGSMIGTICANLTQNVIVHISAPEYLPISQMESQPFDGLASLRESYVSFSDDREEYNRLLDRKKLIELFEGGHDWQFADFRCPQPDGTSRWFSNAIHLIRYPANGDVYYFGYIRDIDRAKQFELSLPSQAKRDPLSTLYSPETLKALTDRILEQACADTLCAMCVYEWRGLNHIREAYGEDEVRRFLVLAGRVLRLLTSGGSISGKADADHAVTFIPKISSAENAFHRAENTRSILTGLIAGFYPGMDLSLALGMDVLRCGESSFAKLCSHALLACRVSVSTAPVRIVEYGDEDFEWPADEAGDGQWGDQDPSFLLDSQKQLALYRTMSHGGVFSIRLDENLTLLYGNDRYYAIHEYTRDSMRERIGNRCSACIHPEDLENIRESARTAIELKKARATWVMRVITGKGNLKYIQTSGEIKALADSWILNGVVIDITEQKNAEKLLKEQKDAEIAEYKKALELRENREITAIVSLRLNLTQNICCDGYAAEGITLDSLQSKTVDEFFEHNCPYHTDEKEMSAYRGRFSRENLLNCFENGQSSLSFDHKMLIAGDSAVWVRTSILMVRNPETNDVEGFIFAHSIDSEKKAEALADMLIRQNFDFAALIDCVTERFTVCRTSDERRSFFSPGRGVSYAELLRKAAPKMLEGAESERLIHELSLDSIREALNQHGKYVLARRVRTPSGQMEFKEWKAAWLDDTHNDIIFTRSDVSALFEAEIDPMTGLLNRQAFYRHVREQLDLGPAAPYALLRCDIDRFKAFNDVLGTDRGDKLLVDLGQKITSSQGQNGIVGRIEADHFAMLVHADGLDVEEWSASLEKWLAEYCTSFRLSASVGVYTVTEPEIDVSLMCDRAFLALQTVKNNYSTKVAYYDDSLRKQLLEEQSLMNDMDRAFQEEQFVLYFQPQINYENGTLIGAESLVRWQHPERGLISPGVFIPLFEKNGLISKLDAYVWDKTCAHMRAWMDSEAVALPIPISVNISRLDLYDPLLCRKIKGLIQKYRLTPSALKLEITESAYMENPEQLIAVTKTLQENGFAVEMDDFGSGYSSLNILKDVPVNILKLDIRFLSEGENDSRGGSILSSVIRMAHWLKIPIIAEGVETKANADYLKSLGCLYMQGYYFSRPIPAEQFKALLSKSEISNTNRYKKIGTEGVAEFWNASAQMALLFNSFVGGAAILEYHGGEVEILRANDRFYHELGTERTDYLDKQLHTLDRFDARNRTRYIDMLNTAIKTGDETECEIQSRPHLKEGRCFWTHNRVRLLAQNSGSYLFYLSLENITDRKNMEERLHVTQEALRQVISQTGRTVCSFDVPSRTLTVPADYAKKHGIPRILENAPEDMSIVISQDWEKYRAFYRQILQGEKSGSSVIRLFNADGSYSWERDTFVTIFSDDGSPLRAIVTAEDITGQKERDMNYERTQLMVARSGVCAFEYDVLGDILYFQTNMQGSGIVNLRVPHCCERIPKSPMVHPDFAVPLQKLLCEVRAGGASAGEFDYLSNNWGSGWRWSRIYYSAISDECNCVYSIVGQINDVQSEKDREALIGENEKSQDE